MRAEVLVGAHQDTLWDCSCHLVQQYQGSRPPLLSPSCSLDLLLCGVPYGYTLPAPCASSLITTRSRATPWGLRPPPVIDTPPSV